MTFRMLKLQYIICTVMYPSQSHHQRPLTEAKQQAFRIACRTGRMRILKAIYGDQESVSGAAPRDPKGPAKRIEFDKNPRKMMVRYWLSMIFPFFWWSLVGRCCFVFVDYWDGNFKGFHLSFHGRMQLPNSWDVWLIQVCSPGASKLDWGRTVGSQWGLFGRNPQGASIGLHWLPWCLFLDAAKENQWTIARCCFWTLWNPEPHSLPIWLEKRKVGVAATFVLFISVIVVSDRCIYVIIIWLVVWNIWIIFPFIGNVIIPTDELHHFSEGWLNHQPEFVFSCFSTWLPSGKLWKITIFNGKTNCKLPFWVGITTVHLRRCAAMRSPRRASSLRRSTSARTTPEEPHTQPARISLFTTFNTLW